MGYNNHIVNIKGGEGMTDNQKKLEELLLQHIEDETKAVCETNNIPQTAMALIELWKITSD